MCKLLPVVAVGLCALVSGCKAPLFSDGLLSSITPRNTLFTKSDQAESQRSNSGSSSNMAARGWRGATSRAATAPSTNRQVQGPASGTNRINQLISLRASGKQLMVNKKYEDARVQYEMILELEPGHAEAHHMLGTINDIALNYKDAEQHYLRALDNNRQDGNLLSDLGYSYLQQGRYAEARQYLMEAITVAPSLQMAKINMAAATFYSGDHQGALAWLNQVGTREQAQTHLAKLMAKPAPITYATASGKLKGRTDGHTILPGGQVLDSDGKPITDYESIEAIMAGIRQRNRDQRRSANEIDKYNERLSMQEASDSMDNFNRKYEQASGTDRQRAMNTQPLHIGSPNNRGGSGQYAPPAVNGMRQQSPPQGQPYQNQPHQNQPHQNSQQDPYSGLLNPGFGSTINNNSGSYPQQPAIQGSGGAVNPHYTGQPLTGQEPQTMVPQQWPSTPTNGGTIPPALTASPWGQPTPNEYRQPPQPLNSGQGTGTIQHNVTDQYGNPQVIFLPARTPLSANSIPHGWSINSPVRPPGTTNPEFGNWQQPPASVGSQTPHSLLDNPTQSYPGYESARLQNQSAAGPIIQPQSATSWNNSQNQVQQLGHNRLQQPSAYIDRGQGLPQYSEAARQAMRLGMDSPLSPLNSSGRTSMNSAAGRSGTQFPQQPQQIPTWNLQGTPSTTSHQPAGVPIWSPGTAAHGRSTTEFAGLDDPSRSFLVTTPTPLSNIVRPSPVNLPLAQNNRLMTQPNPAGIAWRNLPDSPSMQHHTARRSNMTTPNNHHSYTQPAQQSDGQTTTTVNWRQ